MISIVLRLMLILVSVWLLFHVLRCVRKAKVQIDDMIFWLFFSVALIVLAAVPQIAHWAANLIGVISPVNLIYLVIIFVLLLKIFSMSIKFSQLQIEAEIVDSGVGGQRDAAGRAGSPEPAGAKQGKAITYIDGAPLLETPHFSGDR